MDHQEFAKRMKSALQAKSEGRLEDSASELRAVLRDLPPAAKIGVNEWHYQQTLGLLVEVLDQAGNEHDCRAAWLELIQVTERENAYWREALASVRGDFDRWNLAHPSERKSK